MQFNEQQNEISTRFVQTDLPRDMKVLYPRSAELIETLWGDFASIFMACVDQSPIGYLTLRAMFAPDLVWIKDIVIDTNWRRKGVASRLIETAIDWSEERAIKRIQMEMSSKNYPAISLAKKMKFEFSGFNDNFYWNKDIALFFTRDIKKRLSG